MSDVFDYLQWRGDIPFDRDPANEIDHAIFTQLSYLDFHSYVPEGFSSSITLRELAAKDFTDRKPMYPKLQPLLDACAATQRYQDVRVTGYNDILDPAATIQFTAMTFLIGKDTAVIAYRGTDTTLTGWKEDCYLALTGPTSAQVKSVEYLNTAVKELCGRFRGRKIYVVGHSKGGNEAVYAPAFAEPAVQKKVTAIYNYDGPGFDAHQYSPTIFKPILTRIHTYVPEQSIVGMLLKHEEPYQVVASSSWGINQHDVFNWQVLGSHFVSEELSDMSQTLQKAVVDWLLDLSFEDRKTFIDTFFDIIKDAGITRFQDLQDRTLPSMMLMMPQVHRLDHDRRELMRTVLRSLFHSVIENRT
ncbi:MAG: DUF2974 domain-containing protein [Treponemataceae bacterium]|nr:DUF2974 domain-containing protein [Treponemataceae bacterium]